MTILQDILPWLEGWRWEIVQPTSFVVPAGQFSETFRIKGKKGYVLGIGCSGDQPTAIFEFLHHGPHKQEWLIQGSPFALNAGGLTVPNGSGWWTSVYSAVLGVYNGLFTPDSRIGFWYNRTRVRVYAPAGVALNVNTYFHTLVVVEDENLWRNSMRKLFQSQIFKLIEPRKD